MQILGPHPGISGSETGFRVGMLLLGGSAWLSGLPSLPCPVAWRRWGLPRCWPLTPSIRTSVNSPFTQQPSGSPSQGPPVCCGDPEECRWPKWQSTFLQEGTPSPDYAVPTGSLSSCQGLWGALEWSPLPRGWVPSPICLPSASGQGVVVRTPRCV